MMKAIVIPEYGDVDVLTFQDIPQPQPNPDELLIRVHAAALNRADIMQRKGKYPPPPGASEILGLDVAGELVAWGENVTGFTKGDKVFGLVAGGGYAEYCCIDRQMAMPIPKDWSYVEAASVPEVYITANETIFELGQLQPQEKILIHAGASGVGSAGVQMANHIGAEVYFTAGSEEKIDKVKALGATAGFNYKTQNFATELLKATDDIGVNIIEDFIGGKYLMDNLSCLAPLGRLIVVAYMSGPKGEIDLRMLLRKRLQIKSTNIRGRSLADKQAATTRFKQRWLSELTSGAIKPIIDSVFPFEQAKQAQQRMEANLNFGKIVLQI